MSGWEVLASVFGGCCGYIAVAVGRAWRRERALTEQVRGEEWAKTLTAAEGFGWPPYKPLPGLSRSAELAWRETYLRTAGYCSRVTMPDGRTEWIYTQPKEEQR